MLGGCGFGVTRDLFGIGKGKIKMGKIFGLELVRHIYVVAAISVYNQGVASVYNQDVILL